jgi:hypothetical protein
LKKDFNYTKSWLSGIKVIMTWEDLGFKGIISMLAGYCWLVIVGWLLLVA